MSICGICMCWLNEILGSNRLFKCGSCGNTVTIPKEDTTKMKLLTKDEAIERYGKIENGIWEKEASWMVVMSIPPEISANWINTATGKSTLKIYCNKDLVKPLNDVFELIIQRKLCDKLKTFDGCFCIRDRRAIPGVPSWHSYGLAVDINANTNPLGGPSTQDIALVNCFLDAGWIFGGDFHRPDPMHMQWALD